jgi:hypothetical protein
MASTHFRKNIVRTRRAVKTVTELKEGEWRWEYGMQAGLAMGVPVAIFTFFGQLAFGLIASLGGFAGLYCAGRTLKQHVIVLPLVAMGFILASFIGIATAFNDWVTIAALIAVTLVGCTIAIGTNLGPPGGVMFIVVTAASNHMVNSSKLAALPYGVYTIPLLVGVGAFIAYAVVLLLMFLPFMRDNVDPKLPPLSRRLRFTADSYFLIARIVAGVIIASIVGMTLSIQRSYWVIVAVAAILQGGPSRQLTTVRGVQRVLGTLIGVLIFEAIARIPTSGLLIVLFTTLLQGMTQVVIARNYVLGLMFITPLALLNTTIGYASDRGVTIRERIIDTIWGAVIAIVVFLIDEWVRKAFFRKHGQAQQNKDPGSNVA